MPTGFTTKSWATARIADTTLSMAAMGGLHDDGDIEAGFADFCQHAHAIEKTMCTP